MDYAIGVCPVAPFARRHDLAGASCLLELDRLNGTLSGAGTKHLAERAATSFGDLLFANLAQISIAHLYNLRASSCQVSRY